MEKGQNCRTVRILHTGDIHLDSPFARLSLSESESRRAALRDSFSRLMTIVREQDIHVALISGDLFDSAYVTPATASLLIEEFSACTDCRFFISPGNHDPYVVGSLYASGRLPQNVHVFDKEALTCVELPDLHAAVWGWAFTGERYEASPLAGKQVKDPSLLNLVCGHADLFVPLARYAPISLSDLSAFGATYAAFGHRHIPGEGGVTDTGCTYAYCGCLEGRSFDEPGIGGAWLVTAEEKEDGGYTIKKERLTLSPRQYAIEEVDLTGADTPNEVAARMKKVIFEKGYDENTALRVIFTGATPPGFAAPSGADAKAWGLSYIELIDKTTPTYDAAFLDLDLSLRGELYRSLLPQLETGSPEERETAARALRMGLAALAGNDISAL